MTRTALPRVGAMWHNGFRMSARTLVLLSDILVVT
jgi:hypothetical protein